MIMFGTGFIGIRTAVQFGLGMISERDEDWGWSLGRRWASKLA